MSEAYVGEVRIFAGTYAPQGWFFCDGSILPVSGNETLYALLGKVFGGDGINNFGLPDYRSRLIVGAGSGPGLTTRNLGQTGGESTVALVTANTPSHTHNFNVTASPATSQAPAGLVLGAVTPSGSTNGLYISATATPKTAETYNPNFLNIAYGDSGTTASDPHPNEMPSLTLNYIICAQGLYPVRP